MGGGGGGGRGRTERRDGLLEVSNLGLLEVSNIFNLGRRDVHTIVTTILHRHRLHHHQIHRHHHHPSRHRHRPVYTCSYVGVCACVRLRASVKLWEGLEAPHSVDQAVLSNSMTSPRALDAKNSFLIDQVRPGKQA